MKLPWIQIGCAWSLIAGSPAIFAQAPAESAALPRLTIEDLYSEYNVVDANLSPTGKSLAVVVRRENDDAVVLVDLATGDRKVIAHINKDAISKQLDVRIGYIRWKTEDRLLFQVRSDANQSLAYRKLSTSALFKLGNRLYGVDRDGKNLLPMFNKQWDDALVGAFDTSDIASMLNNDPNHILLRVGGWDGKSLFKVDVHTGRGKVVEEQRENVVDWWVTPNGDAVVRMERSLGQWRFYRKLENGNWKKYFTMREPEYDERSEFALIGPTTDPNRFYVYARPPGRDRIGVYLYDLSQEAFGEPVIEHPTFDIEAVTLDREGTRILYYCYRDHIRVCESLNPKHNAYLRGLRKFFEGTANVDVVNASNDGNILLLHVDGPADPPAFYYSMVDQKKIQFLGLRRSALDQRAMSPMTVVHYKTRDGLEQSGYLSLPPDAQGATRLPLVLMPHGGPQVRDTLRFDPDAQYLAARGYAVFQPNFRGSGGFGLGYETSGHRQWGRKMQDDLADGVKALADQGIIDPARVCIYGASYGGYAALAGATLTPNAYRCAVSLAGIADLNEFMKRKKKDLGADSGVYQHYLRKLGDPEKDADALREVSPAAHIDAIKIPILLIHGDKDDNVPFEQSEDFQKLMEKSGRKTQLLRLKNEGHGGFTLDTEKVVLSTASQFLWQHLGPGYGVKDPPEIYVYKE